MAWYNFFTSNDKVVDMAGKTVDGVIAGVDKLFFTDEEKSEASQKTIDTYLEFMKLATDENSVRSMTRRVLAVMILGSFLVMLVAAAIMWRFDPQWAGFVLGCAKSIDNLVLAIGIFYFGPYQLTKMFQAKK